MSRRNPESMTDEQLARMNEIFARGDYWVLNDDHTVRPCTGYADYVNCCGDRATKQLWDDNVFDHEGTEYRVSTVFLALDHGLMQYANPKVAAGGALSPAYVPTLFETMIFGGRFDSDEYQRRYDTYQEAERGHQYACGVARGDAIRLYT